MKDYLFNLVFLFFSYSVFGWCMEVILKFIQYHRFINRGFLIGPYLPIYGFGCILITLAVEIIGHFSYMETSYISVFTVSFFLCGFVEYMASFFMEKRFHARWWDYSTKPMNLNGRIWIGNLLLFGIAGVIVIKISNPFLLNLFSHFTAKIKTIFTISVIILMITDYIFSHFVLKLVKNSIEQSEADNTEQISKEILNTLADKNLFARRFANAYPDVIYKTEKIRLRMAEIKKQTETFRKEAEKHFHYHSLS